jgi:hypothetical protein
MIACLLLLISTSGEWPPELGFRADVFVDGGAGLSQVSLAASSTFLHLTRDTFFSSSTSKTREKIGGNASDFNGVLLYPDGQPRYRLMFVNGGSASQHRAALGSTGRAAIDSFYAAGGSYMGSCAGAYLARPDRKYGSPSIWPGVVGNTNSRGYQSVIFTEKHPLVDYLRSYGSDGFITSIRHYYGPVFRTTYQHPDGTEFLGAITSSIGRGTPYVIAYKESEETGRVVINPSHPEYASSGERLHLTAAMMLYALDGAQQAPDLKGELCFGQETRGIIGDGQYHRYTLAVPDGVERLAFSLIGDADLFVQYEGFAYAGSSLTSGNEILIDAVPGLWHISVFGDHTILNGSAYVLSVGQ